MKRGRKKNRIWPFFLLAALCVAGMELLFCSYYAPAEFARITGPVVGAVEGFCTYVGDSVREAATRLRVRTLLRDCARASAAPFPLEFALPQVAEMPLVPPKEKPAPADPVITRFSMENGQEVLTGGTVPCVYYNQQEAPWSSMAFGGDPIGPYGCGPVAMAMVVSSMTSQPMDPGQMAAWAAENGYWAPQSGSYHSLIPDASVAFGLGCTRLGACSPDQMVRALLGGDMLVALMGPGHFTSSGHFIVLRGVTLGGEVLVADPNSRENSLVTWDPQLLLDQMYVSDGHGLGLWQISAPPPQL
ncbi:hypothetical protein D5272_12550 [bacterium D16-76]|nr:hypothetical protein [bacterium D16-76]